MGERIAIDDRSERQKRIDAMYEASDARMHASMGREMRGDPTQSETQATIERLESYRDMLITRAIGLLDDVLRIERQVEDLNQAIAEEALERNEQEE